MRERASEQLQSVIEPFGKEFVKKGASEQVPQSRPKTVIKPFRQGFVGEGAPEQPGSSSKACQKEFVKDGPSDQLHSLISRFSRWNLREGRMLQASHNMQSNFHPKGYAKWRCMKIALICNRTFSLSGPGQRE